MEKEIGYKDIGEGMSIKKTKDAEYTIRNNETGKERTFVSASQRLLVDDEDIDFELIIKEYGKDIVYDKSTKFGFNRVNDFKNGECRLKWVIYPDGRYFADSDGYGMKDNSEESAICIIDRDLQIIAPFRPPKYIGKEESEMANIEEYSDNFPLSMPSDEVEELDIFQVAESKHIDVGGLLSELEICQQKLRDGIKMLKKDLDLKQLDSNVLAFRFGNLYALINSSNGNSRVLINDRGEILLDLPEKLKKFSEDVGFLAVVNFIPNVSLECKNVTKSGLSIIQISKKTYQDTDVVIDINYNYDDNWGEPIYINEVDVQEHLFYCILGKQFEVLIPVSELTDMKKSCDPELISDEEWEKIWS